MQIRRQRRLMLPVKEWMSDWMLFYGAASSTVTISRLPATNWAWTSRKKRFTQWLIALQHETRGMTACKQPLTWSPPDPHFSWLLRIFCLIKEHHILCHILLSISHSARLGKFSICPLFSYMSVFSPYVEYLVFKRRFYTESNLNITLYVMHLDLYRSDYIVCTGSECAINVWIHIQPIIPEWHLATS